VNNHIATRRNFRADNPADNPAAIASYSKQIANTIKSYKASNNNIHLNQDHLHPHLPILCFSFTTSKQKGMVE
jgi:hypothetical protein